MSFWRIELWREEDSGQQELLEIYLLSPEVARLVAARERCRELANEQECRVIAFGEEREPLAECRPREREG